MLSSTYLLALPKSNDNPISNQPWKITQCPATKIGHPTQNILVVTYHDAGVETRISHCS